MKKNLLLKPYHGKTFFKNGIFDIDQTHNPFYGLKKKLKKINIEINTIDIKKEKPDYNLYCDAPYPWEIRGFVNMLINRNKNILLTFESPLLNPFNHLKFFQYFFKKIYTWNDSQVNNKKIFKFYFPQDLKTMKPINFIDKKLMVMINRNAPGYYRLFSLFGKNNYFKRKKVATFLSKKYERDFDLFGRGWKINSKSYKGEYKGDKLKKLANYKFCICFENASQDGYITEKIFDCFRAGCVPVYLGPHNISKYIPQNTYIDFKGYSDNEKLVRFLKDMEKVEYNKYLTNAKKFLGSKKTIKYWSRDAFEKMIINEVIK